MMVTSSPAPRIAAGSSGSAWKLDIIGVSKRYGAMRANQNVSLDLRSGEIHAVLGENGAGKSTLMKILYGMELPDEGRVELNGAPLAIASPHDAIAAGIGMVHQHFMLVPTLTVLENLVLGNALSGTFVVRRRAIRPKLADLARRYRIDVDLDRIVGELSVGEQQRVEVLKALVRGAQVLILDEPTAVLTPDEVRDLGATLKELAQQGYGIFIVTHKLAEVMHLSDRVSVMRRGQLVATWQTGAVSEAELVTHMVGRTLQAPALRPPRQPRPVMFEMQNVCAPGPRGRPGLNGVSLRVAAGEILGIAGVDGNGQQELAEVITGLRRVTSGQIILDGTAITHRPTAEIFAAGVAHVPQDRHRDGVILDFSLGDNAILVDQSAPIARNGLIDRGAVRQFADDMIRSFTIRGGGPDTPMRSLSGGNQQKAVLARELSRRPKLLVAMQPTRGLDVGAIDDVHTRLIDQREAGMAILLISAELDEIVALSDRVAVLREGAIAGLLDRPSIEAIGPLMLGSLPRQVDAA